MKLKGFVDEDFVNYKKPSMFLIFPYCDWKCEKENSECHCQNSALAKLSIKDYDELLLIHRYLNNDITESIVCGGLEPLDSIEELTRFISLVREITYDDIIIYTGYTEEESQEQLKKILCYSNIVIKYGRYIPNQEGHKDEVLGVNLASNNQYGRRY